eukprot:gene770-9020_t
MKKFSLLLFLALVMFTASRCVRGYGLNKFGNIGIGTVGYTAASVKLQHSELQNILTADCSYAEEQSFCLFLTKENKVFGLGENNHGQLGTGSSGSPSYTPAALNIGNVSISMVSVGFRHSMVLSVEQQVYTFGDNSYGQLGSASTSKKSPSEIVGDNYGIISISAGYAHSLILKNDTTISAFGSNLYGQLGDGTTTSRRTQTPVLGLSGVVRIAAGGHHSIAVTKNGTCYTFGKNTDHQLGYSGGDKSIPTIIPNFFEAVSVACGLYHTLVLKNNSKVYGFGQNVKGQLGQTFTSFSIVIPTLISGPYNNNITSIAAGDYHTILLNSDSNAFTFGLNDYGQLGLGNLQETSTPNSLSSYNTGIKSISAGRVVSLFIKDSEVYTSGLISNPPSSEIQTNSPRSIKDDDCNAISISAGNMHSLLLKETGEVFATGGNEKGQLGIGSNIDQPKFTKITSLSKIVFISAGLHHSFAISNTGVAYGFGLNINGELGDGTKIDRNTPVTLMDGPSEKVETISCGFHHTLLLTENGKVYSFGANGNGELGIGTTIAATTSQLVPIDNIVAISAGNEFSIVVSSNGSLIGFGSDYFGRLGLPAPFRSIYASPVLIPNTFGYVNVVSGHAHSLGLKNDSSVYGFGSSNSGQLIGTAMKATPTLLFSAETRTISIAVGEHFSMFLRNDSTIYSCGDNINGQLGIGSFLGQIATPNLVANQTYMIAAGIDHAFILGHESEFTCFGNHSTNPFACSGRGNCTGADSCSCKIGFYGNNCQSYACYGVDSTQSSVCSGTGTCVTSDQCVCNTGWEGQLCNNRVLLWDLISSTCHSNCLLNKTFWSDCLLIQGKDCYCNHTSQFVSVSCSEDKHVTKIMINNANLNGTIIDLRGYLKLKELDLSGNNLLYPVSHNFLPYSIETLVLNNITNGQRALNLDIDKNTYKNLTTLSLERNNLCGPFPSSWRNLTNLNLKSHSKTLWCDETVNDACTLLNFTNGDLIVGNNRNNADLTFNTSCDLDFSVLKCGNDQSSYGNITASSRSSVTCDFTSATKMKNQVFLTLNNEKISVSLPLYRITRQYLYFINGTPAAILDHNVTLKFKLEYPISKEVHKYLRCVVAKSNSTYIVTTINGEDNQVTCTVKGNSYHPFISSGTGVSLRFFYSNQTFEVGKTFRYFMVYEPKSISSSSRLGYSNETKTIEIYYSTEISHFSKHQIRLTVNNSYLIPEEPYTQASNGFIGILGKNFIESVYKNGSFFLVRPTDAFVSMYGDQNYFDMDGSPYLKYKVIIEENNAGYYYVFHSGTVDKATSFFIGTNTTNFVEVVRPAGVDGYYPPASKKEAAPQLYFPKVGENYLYVWRGNNSFPISNIAFFKAGLGGLNFIQLSVQGSYYPFTVKIGQNLRAGISDLKLTWKGTEKDLTVASNELRYATVDKGLILGFHPSAGLTNTLITIQLFTNIQPTDYNGLLNYYCLHGGKTSNAVQIGTAFSCTVDFSTAGTFDVNLYANYTVSKETILISQNSATIAIFEPLSNEKMTPFVSNQIQNSTAISFSATGFPSDFSKVLCRHVSKSYGTLYYNATSITGRAFCLMKNPLFVLQNLDFSEIGFWINSSTSFGGEDGFYLSKNLTHLIIQDPIQTNISDVVFGSDLPFRFDLNVSRNLPSLPFDFSLILNFVGGSTILNCHSPFGCSVNSINTAKVPSPFSIRLVIDNGGVKENFDSKPYYFSTKIPIQKESPYPFILNPFTSSTIVKFVVLEDEIEFNENFNYYCLDSRNSKKIKAIQKNQQQITCEIESRHIDETFSIGIYVNTTIPGLNTLISDEMILRYDDLKLEPKYFDRNIIPTFQIYANDSSKYVIPSNYSALPNYKLTTGSCIVNSTDTICTLGGIVEDVLNFSIFLKYFAVYQENNLLIDINKPVLTYKSNKMDISPHATLIGNNKTIIMTFKENTLSAKNISDIEYYCEIKENGMKYRALKMSSKQLNCSIPYLGMNEISLNGLIRVPSVSNDFITISSNSSKIYYIEQKELILNATNDRFHYSQQLIDLWFNLTTHVDSSLLQYVTCKLQRPVITSFFLYQKEIYSISQNQMSHCRFLAHISGRQQIFLQFVDGEEEFSMTTNSIDLVFVFKDSITKVTPTVGFSNITTPMEIETSVTALDYGNFSVVTKFGFDSDPYYNQTNSTDHIVNGNVLKFNTSFFIEKQSSFKVSIFMICFGRELEITQPISYKFIDSNYFTPNHGVISGGELVKILKPTTSNSKVVIGGPFNIDNMFNCSLGSELVCLSPQFNSSFQPFTSYNLYFNEDQVPLSAKFILYEKRSIVSIHPTIIPLAINFEINITLDEMVIMTEGSAILNIIGPKKVTLEYGVLKSNNIYKTGIPSDGFTAGNHEVFLNYKNVESLDFDEQFTFTDSKNVTFVDTAPQFFMNLCDAVAYVNETTPVKLKREKDISSSLLPFVKCKISTEIVPTIRISDSEWICNVSSVSAGTQYISLWYIGSDTLNGEMMISSNVLPIIFVEKITINSVQPFTTLTTVNTTIKLSTNLKSNVYTGNAAFVCSYSGIRYIAFFSNGIFTCNIKDTGIPRIENVELEVHHKFCGNPKYKKYSTNSVPFIFRKTVELVSILPFSKSFSNSFEVFKFNVSLSLKATDTVVSDSGLYCIYNSSVHGFQTSKATLNLGNVTCEVTKSQFPTTIEYIHVGLSLSNSSIPSDLSNLMKVVFYKQSLEYKNLSILDDSLNGNFEIDLAKYESNLNYKIRMIEQLSPSTILNFDCEKKSKLECKPTKLNPNRHPGYYYLNLVVLSDSNPSVEVLVTMKPITYYNRNIKVVSVVPYFASYLAHKFNPLKVYLQFDVRLRLSFPLYCTNSTNKAVLSPAKVENPGPFNSTVSCEIKSKSVEMLSLTVSFEQNGTYYELSTVSNINFIEPISLGKNFHGYNNGKGNFSFQIPTEFPTVYKNDYNITYRYNDHNQVNNLDCTRDIDGVTCGIPKIESKIYPTFVQFSVYIDDIEAIELTPSFKYLQVPSITKISPSYLVDIFTISKRISIQSSSFVAQKITKKNTIMIRYEELNENHICDVESFDQISCPISKASIPFVVSVGSFVTLKFSLDGTHFELLDKKIFLYNDNINIEKCISLVANTLSPSIVSNSNPLNVTISIIVPIPLPTNEIYVRFKDLLVNEIITGEIRDGRVICEIPQLMTYNLIYPRKLTVQASMDGVSFFGDSQTIEMTGFDAVDFTPKSLISGQSILKFSNFPKLKLKTGETIQMYLKSLSQIAFDCDENMLCTSNSPTPVGEYIIEFYLNGEQLFVPLVNDKIKIINTPGLFLPTKKISKQMINMVYLEGNGFSNFKDSIQVRGKFSGIFHFASVVVLSDKIGFKFGPINGTNALFSTDTLDISYNNGFTFISVSDVELIDVFNFQRVVVQDSGALSTTYSFINTTLLLEGSNLNGSSIVRLETELSTYEVGVQNTNPNSIKVTIPEFKYFSPKYEYTFPISGTIGISSNDGIDFQKKSITIDDKYATLYLVSIDPSIGERKSVNISMTGANLVQLTACEFKIGTSQIIQTVPVSQIGEVSICSLDYNSTLLDPIAELNVNLVNNFNDTSDSVSYYFVQNPFPQTITPSFGAAAGNYDVIISGNFDIRFKEIYLRIGPVKVGTACQILDAASVKCRVPSNGAQSVGFELSYNRIDWYKASTNFTFVPCEAGYGTSSYQEPCTPCPLGQFKSSLGLEVCTNCPINTYADQLGSLNCTSCPERMISPGRSTGLTNINQCVCQNNTLVHPKTNLCINCPEGAICNGENVTFPKSKKGWWFSKEDITIFYQCYPVERCLPDTPNNCTVGYESIRCGVCQDGYFKSKLLCSKCNDIEITALTLVEDFEPEDTSTTMNEIIEDVFSFRRVRKNANELSTSGRLAAFKIVKKTKLDRLTGRFSSNAALLEERDKRRRATTVVRK